jgi:hypothetical protein
VTFDRARAIADAVLYEGYALYPYRPSSVKNQFRFPFGVLAPRAWSEAGGSESWWMETQCLVEGTGRLEGRLRFLHELEVAEVDFALGLTPFEVGSAIEGVVRARVEDVGPFGRRLVVRVENRTPWAEPGASRDRVLSASCISAHLLLATSEGRFLSAIDPPAGAPACRQTRAFPVLASEGDDIVLAAPIILYDHPRVAPESPQDLFDGTEIDEILTLRTRSMTDEEKAEARAWDPRVAALLERADGLGPGSMAELHGTFRDLVAGEMVPRQGAPRNDPDAAREAGIGPGARVTLRPRKGTDAQDLLYAGMAATVEAVVRDVGGDPHLLVTIDGDPAAELHRWYGRFHYYRLDEVER